jgi:hypothetical protein
MSQDADPVVPLLDSDILSLIRDPKFAKRSEEFLTDLLGGRPNVTFGASCDIFDRG